MLNQIKERVKIALNRYSRHSYSQEGEDLLLERYLGDKKDGFYVDLGAHHPFRFSNTYRLYQKGWRGVCVDANPLSMKSFRKHRPRDICLEMGVSDREDVLEYFFFEDHALNTFSAERAKRVMEISPYRVSHQISIPVKPINSLLNEFVPAGVSIDLLTIDIEGLDEVVLRALDWSRYAPTFVVLENHEFDPEYPERSQLHLFMQSKGYQLVSKLYISVVYRKRNS